MAKFRIYKQGRLYYAKEKISWFTWSEVRDYDEYKISPLSSPPTVYFRSVREAIEYLRKKVESRKVFSEHYLVEEITI